MKLTRRGIIFSAVLAGLAIVLPRIIPVSTNKTSGWILRDGDI